jgi:hypothetical protein
VKQLKISEEQEQIALFDWADYQPKIGEYLLHIPNGGSRHFLEAKKLKRMGVRKGVPDIFFAKPMGEWHGLFIELKSNNKPKGKITKDQKIWLDRLLIQGYNVAVCYGFEDARDHILNYLKGEQNASIQR